MDAQGVQRAPGSAPLPGEALLQEETHDGLGKSTSYLGGAQYLWMGIPDMIPELRGIGLSGYLVGGQPRPPFEESFVYWSIIALKEKDPI